jgi:hypothetical protein
MKKEEKEEEEEEKEENLPNYSSTSTTDSSRRQQQTSGEEVDEKWKGIQDQSYLDAMHDIFLGLQEEKVSHSPPHSPYSPHSPLHRPLCSSMKFPLIEIAEHTNTDELFEIVKQAIWKLAHLLSQQETKRQKKTKQEESDFGEDSDAEEEKEKEEQQSPPPSRFFFKENSQKSKQKQKNQTQKHKTNSIRLVFDAFVNLQNNGAKWIGNTNKLSRLKFQGGLVSLLSIQVSWHQFGNPFLLLIY